MSWWRDILGIPKKVWDINMLGFDILEDLATGDVDRDTLDTLFELYGAAWDLGSAVEKMAQTTAILAAIIAYPMLVTAIANGSITIPYATELGLLYVSLESRLSPIIDKFQAAERRVKGIIDTEAVQQALSLANTAHTLGMVLSSSYREEIEQLQNSTQQIARRVFGDASMVNSALTILQMAYYDGARLRGETVDVAEQDYLKAQIDLLHTIERSSAKYARSPGLFWYDFNAFYLDPQIHNNNIEQHKRDSRLQGAINGVARVSDASKAIDKSFREYRRELDPFLSKENAMELDAMRRAYTTDVLIPLQTIDATVKREFPAIKALADEIDKSVTNNAENIQDLAEFQTDPSELDPESARAVSAKWRSMIDHTLGFDGETPEDLKGAQDDIAEIYEKL